MRSGEGSARLGTPGGPSVPVGVYESSHWYARATSAFGSNAMRLRSVPTRPVRAHNATKKRQVLFEKVLVVFRKVPVVFQKVPVIFFVALCARTGHVGTDRRRISFEPKALVARAYQWLDSYTPTGTLGPPGVPKRTLPSPERTYSGRGQKVIRSKKKLHGGL